MNDCRLQRFLLRMPSGSSLNVYLPIVSSSLSQYFMLQDLIHRPLHGEGLQARKNTVGITLLLKLWKVPRPTAQPHKKA